MFKQLTNALSDAPQEMFKTNLFYGISNVMGTFKGLYLCHPTQQLIINSSYGIFRNTDTLKLFYYLFVFDV